MKRVYQQQAHNPPDSIGDCFRACLASILELPIEALPAPAPGNPKRSFDDHWTEIGDLLKAMGLFLIEVTLPIVGYTQGAHDGHWIAGGVAEGSGLPHFCVYLGHNTLRHDPNPNGLGLSKLECGIWIVPIRPAVGGS